MQDLKSYLLKVKLIRKRLHLSKMIPLIKQQVYTENIFKELIKNKYFYNSSIEERIKQEEEAMRKQLEENDKAMKLMQQTYEEKLAAAKAQV
jgi:hypothetical protein